MASWKLQVASFGTCGRHYKMQNAECKILGLRRNYKSEKRLYGSEYFLKKLKYNYNKLSLKIII